MPLRREWSSGSALTKASICSRCRVEATDAGAMAFQKAEYWSRTFDLSLTRADGDATVEDGLLVAPVGDSVTTLWEEQAAPAATTVRTHAAWNPRRPAQPRRTRAQDADIGTIPSPPIREGCDD